MRQETRGILIGVAIAGAIIGAMYTAIHDGGVDVAGQCRTYEARARACAQQRRDDAYFAETGRHVATSTAPGDNDLLRIDDGDEQDVRDCRIERRDSHLRYDLLAECATESSCDAFDQCVDRAVMSSHVRRSHGDFARRLF